MEVGRVAFVPFDVRFHREARYDLTRLCIWWHRTVASSHGRPGLPAVTFAYDRDSQAHCGTITAFPLDTVGPWPLESALREAP